MNRASSRPRMMLELLYSVVFEIKASSLAVHRFRTKQNPRDQSEREKENDSDDYQERRLPSPPRIVNAGFDGQRQEENETRRGKGSPGSPAKSIEHWKHRALAPRRKHTSSRFI